MRRWLTDEEYERYRASREWALLKQQVRARSGSLCERCKRHPATIVHHVTYIRVGHERLEDLLNLCAGCYEFLTARASDDACRAMRARYSGETIPRLWRALYESIVDPSDRSQS